jgi:TRAP-type C4-dicarboxylate transport system substrate-binding protein
MKGLKFRVGGGVSGNAAKALGVTAMLASATKNYEMLSSGVADGTFLPTESIKSFKLTKLLNYATKVPGGLYNTSFFLTMNPAKFNSLSADNQAALMRASGENFARIAGEGWDKHDALGQAAMNDAGIATIIASDAFVAEIKAATAHLESDWIATANGLGVDGVAVMADLRAEIAKVAAE